MGTKDEVTMASKNSYRVKIRPEGAVQGNSLALGDLAVAIVNNPAQ